MLGIGCHKIFNNIGLSACREYFLPMMAIRYVSNGHININGAMFPEGPE